MMLATETVCSKRFSVIADNICNDQHHIHRAFCNEVMLSACYFFCYCKVNSKKETDMLMHKLGIDNMTVQDIMKYTVSQKNIPNIFDCNLKTNYQILIIFAENIPDTTCH